MTNKDKHILFHRPTPWDSALNCSTKTYARLFASKGYRVSYLQSNINPVHRLLRKGYFHTWKKGNRFEQDIWVCGTMSWIPYIDRFKSLIRLLAHASYRWTSPSYQRLLAAGYGDPDIIWTTIPGSTALKKHFPRAKLYFHVVDQYSAYRGSAVETLEQEDYQKADRVFVIGEALKQYVMQTFDVPEHKIINLGQGVHLERYQRKMELPDEYKGLKGPIAVWVGLTKKLDRSLLQQFAIEFEQYGGHIVLIGPEDTAIETLVDQHSHMHFLGPKESDEVPAYLVHASIGLMLYDREKKEIYKGQHPLKLYEYAAASLAVMSTEHTEFETLNPPVTLVNSETDISSQFPVFMQQLKEQQTAMRAFAQEHSWERCAAKAEQVF